MNVSLDCQCSPFLGRHVPLDVGLGEVGAVNFDEDLGVVLLLLLLFVERPSEVDEVERQQEPQHAEGKESNVDLEENTRVKTCPRVLIQAQSLFE